MVEYRTIEYRWNDDASEQWVSAQVGVGKFDEALTGLEDNAFFYFENEAEYEQAKIAVSYGEEFTIREVQ